MTGFNVSRRNPHHWDIYPNEPGMRLFRIRGERGNHIVLDERDNKRHYPQLTFHTIGQCLEFIANELITE